MTYHSTVGSRSVQRLDGGNRYVGASALVTDGLRGAGGGRPAWGARRRAASTRVRRAVDDQGTYPPPPSPCGRWRLARGRHSLRILRHRRNRWPTQGPDPGGSFPPGVLHRRGMLGYPFAIGPRCPANPHALRGAAGLQPAKGTWGGCRRVRHDRTEGPRRPGQRSEAQSFLRRRRSRGRACCSRPTYHDGFGRYPSRRVSAGYLSRTRCGFNRYAIRGLGEFGYRAAAR